MAEKKPGTKWLGVSGLIGGRQEGCRTIRECHIAAGRLDLGLEGLTVLHGVVDQADETGRIEIHVGQGRKHRLAGETVDVRILDTGLARGRGRHGKTLEGIHQKVLKRRRIGGFAADTDFGASFALSRLFTLIAKH